MSDTSKFIMASIQQGQKSYTSKQTTTNTKTTWQSYVKDNYKHAAKQSGHPMTTLSQEYNRLKK